MARNRFLDFGPMLGGMPLIPRGGLNFLSMPNELVSHTHDGYEITYVNKGEVTWEVQHSKPLHLCGGDMAITQPRVRHQGEHNIVRPCRLMWFIVRPTVRFARNHTPFSTSDLLAMNAVLRTAGNSVSRAPAELEPLFEALNGCLCPQADETSSFTVALFQSLLIQALIRAVRAFSTGLPGRQSPLVARAQRFMQDNIDKQLPIADIAAHVGVSESWLFESFKKEAGLTPADYLMRLRCDKARKLLAEANLSVTTIAIDLGFSSSQYFATCFRKYTGMTPSRFRATRSMLLR